LGNFEDGVLKFISPETSENKASPIFTSLAYTDIVKEATNNIVIIILINYILTSIIESKLGYTFGWLDQYPRLLKS
jgi:Na+/phosphate symporter